MNKHHDIFTHVYWVINVYSKHINHCRKKVNSQEFGCVFPTYKEYKKQTSFLINIIRNSFNHINHTILIWTWGALYYENVGMKNVMIMRNKLLYLIIDVASDRTSGPRFLAAEASIFTSETPSITPFCFSSEIEIWKFSLLCFLVQG